MNRESTEEKIEGGAKVPLYSSLSNLGKTTWLFVNGNGTKWHAANDHHRIILIVELGFPGLDTLE
jgi:hypothetical protein